MPDQPPSGDRNAAQRAADHAGIARLADALVPALVAKLGAANLGEVEIREGDWHVRVRRPAGTGPRRERPHRASLPIVAPPGAAATAPAAPGEEAGRGPRQEPALSPTVGMFKPGVATGTRVRAGDRIATVDLLGIALDVVAPIDGIVIEVYPQAGDGVEYGEELAMVEGDPEAETTTADEAGEG
ncbi:MAG: acetyl-CoA carboxylase biotin carboxyl carrier protein [Candidatus Limnocylindrales bacterium]